MIAWRATLAFVLRGIWTCKGCGNSVLSLIKAIKSLWTLLACWPSLPMLAKLCSIICGFLTPAASMSFFAKEEICWTSCGLNLPQAHCSCKYWPKSEGLLEAIFAGSVVSCSAWAAAILRCWPPFRLFLEGSSMACLNWFDTVWASCLQNEWIIEIAFLFAEKANVFFLVTGWQKK